jgi:MSHA biogenesis protein MshQ
LLPLSINTFMQYYDGTFFVINTLDNCTTLAINDVDLSNNEQASERDGSISINGATVTASVQNSPALNGGLNIDLTAPGAGNTGYIEIQPDLSTATGADLPWLLFDWDGDAGTADEAPLGRATFGIFGGNPQQIYMQELY